MSCPDVLLGSVAVMGRISTGTCYSPEYLQVKTTSPVVFLEKHRLGKVPNQY